MGVFGVMTMKRVSMAVLAGFLLAGTVAGPAMAASVCLRVRDIRNSDAAKDGGSITFKMADGKTYRNDLEGKCQDLWFNGFTWTLHSDQVCDGELGIKVLRSGEVCKLGKFTEVTSAPKG
jgi:hypothetical protein